VYNFQYSISSYQISLGNKTGQEDLVYLLSDSLIKLIECSGGVVGGGAIPRLDRRGLDMGLP
jgi:hypothetical protein